jgi:glutamate/tyrosine decarboxylase-like PLP-dependent enzyme
MSQQTGDLLALAASLAQRYVTTIADRRVIPDADAIAALHAFSADAPSHPQDAETVLRQLDALGSPATVASTGGRYFGFVTGGVLPAALAANWLAGAWDQNCAFTVMSPIVAALEGVVLRWLVDLLNLPPTTGAGFVTGATLANFTALAAARCFLLGRAGWDVGEDGLFGAPPLTVVVGDEVHVSLLKALSLLGLGRSRVVRVPVDDQGRMRVDALPALSPMTIVCTQAGNVNTGAFDPIGAICAAAQDAGAWVHVDGAFGLWAAAAPTYAHLTTAVEQADSWATDAHKWLNVPYDSGIAFCRQPEHLRAAMATSAAYLVASDAREPCHYTPEMSRRARGVELWAALASLGRSGLADLIDRTCAHARRFAAALSAAGYAVLNDVVLNQVLVAFGTDEITRRVIAAVQTDGVCWCGGTVWQGKAAMRISVSSWATTETDVDASLESILRIARMTR